VSDLGLTPIYTGRSAISTSRRATPLDGCVRWLSAFAWSWPSRYREGRVLTASRTLDSRVRRRRPSSLVSCDPSVSSTQSGFLAQKDGTSGHARAKSGMLPSNASCAPARRFSARRIRRGGYGQRNIVPPGLQPPTRSPSPCSRRPRRPLGSRRNISVERAVFCGRRSVTTPRRSAWTSSRVPRALAAKGDLADTKFELGFVARNCPLATKSYAIRRVSAGRPGSSGETALVRQAAFRLVDTQVDRAAARSSDDVVARRPRATSTRTSA